MSKTLVYASFVMFLLAPVVGLAGYDRVAYYDDDYPTNWADRATAQNVRDAVADAGYTIVNAAELKDWMDGRIASGGLSVVIMCNDIFPDTVVETNTEECTVRQYLNAGGKIVFYADIPFYNQGHADGSNTNWGGGGATGILGFNTAPDAAPASWDANSSVTITDLGITWGLTATWSSVRPTAADAWPDLTILATDETGNAVGWAAHYVPGDTFRGFVRIRDVGGMPNVEDLIRIAEYAENIEMATGPVPETEAVDVLRDVVLSWLPGSTAATHDVYFGASFDDVNAATRDNPLGVLVSESQSEATYDPEGLLEFGTTYYWRIDEVNSAPDFTIFRGEIWSFTAEPFAYPVENVIATSNAVTQAGAVPENMVNGSGLNALDQHSIESPDMWLGVAAGDDPVQIQYEFDRVYKLHEMLVWNYNVQFELMLGFGVKDVTVEYSENGVDWTVLGDVQLNQATAKADYTANTTIDFGGAAAKFVKFTVNSTYGFLPVPQYGLSEVRFLFIPAHAREPEPDDGATDVTVDTILGWRAGRDAISHEVNLGADPAALALAGTADATSFDPGALDLATTYYWQVDAIQETESWAGSVWSFSTQAFLIVDDFESYTDDIDAGEAIFLTWIDGYEVNGNGSMVGNLEAPFAEQTIVRSGRQSMPLFYDNTSAPMSEAELTLAGQDWSASGIKSLTLWFRGDTNNASGQLYVKINGTKIPYDGDAADIGIAGWQKWSIVLADTGANLSNVTTLTVGVEGSGSGVVYIDDIRLSPEVSAPRTSDIGIAISGQANWWSQDAADREIEEIVDNAQAPVVVFNAGDEDGLADWLVEHTGNGVANLLILCGKFPDSIYAGANAEPDGSLAELFLDDGNTIINTGDWIFYVGSVANNSAEGLQNMMDIPAVTVVGGDDTAVTVTAEGQELTPSLQDLATDRPFHLDTLEGDWYAELILAQNADGTLADPVIVRNSATGGRIGIFYQTNGQDDDPRGEVMSEWINNWYLDAASGN